MKNKEAYMTDSEDDSDGCNIVESNCESAMVEGQICSIPYELYDLPDLKRILSIETWNSFLSDEERFFLSSFLPDMDQQTFNLTMKELLSGSNLYFGNPLHRFYQKLRGGLLVPKVACCTEYLMLVKRKRYYYSLRSHHENTIQTFTDMRRLWDQYKKEMGINERLFYWSKRTQSRNPKLPDLNRVPSELNRPGHVILPLLGDSKGILKSKIRESRIFQNHSPNPVCGEDHHQSVPRGLLKVVTNPPSTCVKDPDIATSSDASRDKTSSPFQATAYSCTIIQTLDGGRVNTMAELPKCVLNQQDTLSIFPETIQRSIRRVKKKDADPSLDESADTRQQDLLRGFGFSKHFTGQDLCTSEEQYACFYQSFPISKAKILGTGSGTKETARTRP